MQPSLTRGQRRQQLLTNNLQQLQTKYDAVKAQTEAARILYNDLNRHLSLVWCELVYFPSISKNVEDQKYQHPLQEDEFKQATTASSPSHILDQLRNWFEVATLQHTLAVIPKGFSLDHYQCRINEVGRLLGKRLLHHATKEDTLEELSVELEAVFSKMDAVCSNVRIYTERVEKAILRYPPPTLPTSPFRHDYHHVNRGDESHNAALRTTAEGGINGEGGATTAMRISAAGTTLTNFPKFTTKDRIAATTHSELGDLPCSYWLYITRYLSNVIVALEEEEEGETIRGDIDGDEEGTKEEAVDFLLQAASIAPRCHVAWRILVHVHIKLVEGGGGGGAWGGPPLMGIAEICKHLVEAVPSDYTAWYTAGNMLLFANADNTISFSRNHPHDQQQVNVCGMHNDPPTTTTQGPRILINGAWYDPILCLQQATLIKEDSAYFYIMVANSLQIKRTQEAEQERRRPVLIDDDNAKTCQQVADSNMSAVFDIAQCLARAAEIDPDDYFIWFLIWEHFPQDILQEDTPPTTTLRVTTLNDEGKLMARVYSRHDCLVRGIEVGYDKLGMWGELAILLLLRSQATTTTLPPSPPFILPTDTSSPSPPGGQQPGDGGEGDGNHPATLTLSPLYHHGALITPLHCAKRMVEIDPTRPVLWKRLLLALLKADKESVELNVTIMTTTNAADSCGGGGGTSTTKTTTTIVVSQQDCLKNSLVSP